MAKGIQGVDWQYVDWCDGCQARRPESKEFALRLGAGKCVTLCDTCAPPSKDPYAKCANPADPHCECIYCWTSLNR